ncbi:MAG: serine/threonine protein kinase [Archangiaceae bacterium]|nr:serine/threonine protein kinase [Archangiaceae bacterium]
MTTRGALTHDAQLDALLRQVAAVSVEAARAEPPLPAGSHFGPFRLLEIAGAGGMGVVYRALDERLSREVALKLLPQREGADPQQLLDEARAAASLSHPNLASVYEAGTLEGRAFFAMELVRGTSLRALLQQASGSKADRLDWALGVARGLAALHRAGWLHRDVKPENVMVTPDGVAKLLDLGLARAAAAAAPAQAAGTPGYMSPEQQRGEALDARADVWSLGQVLRELGAPRRVTDRCLEAERGGRFASAVEVVAALEQARRPRPARWRWLVAAPAVALAGWWAWAASHPVKPRRPPPSRRLTGHAMNRPLSDAALSHDGRTFAFVDDDGLFLGDPATPDRLDPVTLEGQPSVVSPARGGFVVLSRDPDGQRSLWHLAGGAAKRFYRGPFKYASASPALDRVVAIEGRRVVVRRTSDGAELHAVTHPASRFLNAAVWSTAGELYAVSASERVQGDLLKVLELWAPDGDAPVWSLRSQRLSQGYVPVVLGWSARGALLYALADLPGEGNGSAVWSLDRPGAEPTLLDHVDGQFFSMLGQAANGHLLTARESTHLRVQLADVSEQGALSQPRTLTQSELDERPCGWESSSAVLLMSLRELVPHLARRALDAPAPQWLRARGWAQTWPTATGRPGELLYWWADRPAEPEGPLRWALQLEAVGTARTLELPAVAVGRLSSMAPGPHGQRVRCAVAARACVLAHVDGEQTSFYDLALDGGAPTLRFTVPTPQTVSLFWALSVDGSRVALADDELLVRVRDRSGRVLAERAVPGLRELRGLAFDAPGTGFYVTGMGADELQRIGWLPHGGGLEVLQTAVSAFGELQLSPDQKTLAYLEKQFDSDVWLTPLD